MTESNARTNCKQKKIQTSKPSNVGKPADFQYSCLHNFSKGVTEEKIRKAALTVMKLKLTEIEDHSLEARTDGKRQSIIDANGDILVVPQVQPLSIHSITSTFHYFRQL